MGAVAAIFILALYPAIVLSISIRIYHWKKYLGLISLPVLWVGMEYFRSLSQFAFPWTDVAYSQGYYLRFIQIVSVVGSYGLSFFLMALNVCLWQAKSKLNTLERRVGFGITAIFIPVAIFLYGWVVFPPLPVYSDIKVALLQGNVDLETKWSSGTRDENFMLYDSLAREAANDSVELVIWPETAAPCYPRLEPKYRDWIGKIAVESRAYNLVGALEVETKNDRERSYNSAYQFAPDGTMGARYDKMYLVPFSEHVPYQDYMPFLTREFLSRYVNLIRTNTVEWWSDFYPGDSAVVFKTDSAQYSVLICFESAFPNYVRQCLLKGAEFMVNITNDTWFGRSPGPFQHFRIAVFRAVENRVWIARCANSGISALIDPYGRETAEAGLYIRKVVTGKVGALDEYTVFTKIGPVFGQFSLLITAAVIFILALVWLKTKLQH